MMYMKNPAHSRSSIWMQGVVGNLWGKAGSTGPAPGGLVSLLYTLISTDPVDSVLLQGGRA